MELIKWLCSEVVFSEYPSIKGFFENTPDILLRLALSAIRVLALLTIVSINKSFFEQGFGVCRHDKKNIFATGLTAYFFAFALSLIFFLAVVTYPISALILVIIQIAALCGEVSLAMHVGGVLTGRPNPVDGGRKKNFSGHTFFKKGFPFNSFVNIAVGGITVECLSYVPYFRYLYSYFVLPVICIGILVQTWLNAALYKKFYELPYDDCKDTRNNVRDIITNGLD